MPVHAPSDSDAARQLSVFLESGAEATIFVEDGLIRTGEDLFSACERGLSADVLVLLLSSVSNPTRWARDVWEPLLVHRAAEAGTRVAVFLLEDCIFPPLLRRGSSFCDASAFRVPAMRRLKRWLVGLAQGTEPTMNFSPDLEPLYATLADRPGSFTAPGPLASKFAREAARDFDAVHWVPAFGRSLLQIAGDLGSQLEMRLDGPLESNCPRIRALLAPKRCLLVFDAPEVPVDRIVPGGRTSVLYTSTPVRLVDDPTNLAGARTLVAAGRFAEAYEILTRLFASGEDTHACARELVWICDHWDRVEEANLLRFHVGPQPSEQLRLF